MYFFFKFELINCTDMDDEEINARLAQDKLAEQLEEALRLRIKPNLQWHLASKARRYSYLYN